MECHHFLAQCDFEDFVEKTFPILRIILRFPERKTHFGVQRLTSLIVFYPVERMRVVSVTCSVPCCFQFENFLESERIPSGITCLVKDLLNVFSQGKECAL